MTTTTRRSTRGSSSAPSAQDGKGGRGSPAGAARRTSRSRSPPPAARAPAPTAARTRRRGRSADRERGGGSPGRRTTRRSAPQEGEEEDQTASSKAKAKAERAEAEEGASSSSSSSSTDDDDLPLSKLAQKASARAVAEAGAEAGAKEAKDADEEEVDGNAGEEEEEEATKEEEVEDTGTEEPPVLAPASAAEAAAPGPDNAEIDTAGAAGKSSGGEGPDAASAEDAAEVLPPKSGDVGGEERDAVASFDLSSVPLGPAPPADAAAATSPPSAAADPPLPMDVEEKAAISPAVAPSPHGNTTDRKRSMPTEEDVVSSSPGKKRQRLAPADDPPPLPPGPPPEHATSQQGPSRVVTQDTADTNRQRAPSPPAAASPSPTTDMAVDQPTPLKPDQDKSDESCKALKPASSGGSPVVDASLQPPTSPTLEETLPRSMSVSPPSDPSHSGLGSPVPFAEHEHNNEHQEEAMVHQEKEEELESVEYTPAPCLDTIKMTIFLEGCKAHRGKGPERRFADYWDALARNIALGLRGKDRSKRCSKDEACNGIEYILSSFLTTKRLKRLHNELILAIMEQSLGTFVAEDKFKRHIPVAWRGRAQRKLGFPQKPSLTATKSGGDVETQNQEGSAETALQEDVALDIADSRRIRSMLAYESSVWSVRGQRGVSEKSENATDIATGNISNAKTLSLPRPVVPSAYLPGALIIDPLVRSLATAENMNVSEDAIWLAIVAVREHATATLRQALQNKSEVEQNPTDVLGNSISSRTITSSDLALSNDNGPRSSRLSADQGLISRSNSLQPCVEYVSAEMNVTRAIHLAARRRLLALGLPASDKRKDPGPAELTASSK